MWHQVRLLTTAAALFSLIAVMSIYGLSYYRLAIADRIFDEKHSELKPSGSIGLRLGMAGLFLFCCLYLYPVRKRSKLLQRIGKTKNWLDFHILFGISAPLLVTLHSSFKVQGLAGVAYWLMMAVMLSGFVGRYFYGQIPRRLNATELSLKELQQLSATAAKELGEQHVFSAVELTTLMRFPTPREVEEMSLVRAVRLMVWMDLQRPFRVAALRRLWMDSWIDYCRTLGGLLPSPHPELEQGIALVRRHSWLLAKMTFLSRTSRVFLLWHVIHRPFSYSFAVLVIVHITVVILMGYF
jgi:hypothetical protein